MKKAWTVKLEPSKSNCYIDMWEPKTGHREKHWSCAEGTGEGFRRQKCIVADFTFNRACCFTVMLQYHIWGKKKSAHMPSQAQNRLAMKKVLMALKVSDSIEIEADERIYSAKFSSWWQRECSLWYPSRGDGCQV